jgi:hypothetical protein
MILHLISPTKMISELIINRFFFLQLQSDADFKNIQMQPSGENRLCVCLRLIFLFKGNPKQAL